MTRLAVVSAGLGLEHALRPLFSYLRAIVVPTGVFAAPEDWGAGGAATSALSARVERAGAELAALLSAHPTVRARDQFEEPTPFESLLRADG